MHEKWLYGLLRHYKFGNPRYLDELDRLGHYEGLFNRALTLVEAFQCVDLLFLTVYHTFLPQLPLLLRRCHKERRALEAAGAEPPPVLSGRRGSVVYPSAQTFLNWRREGRHDEVRLTHEGGILPFTVGSLPLLQLPFFLAWLLHT